MDKKLIWREFEKEGQIYTYSEFIDMINDVKQLNISNDSIVEFIFDNISHDYSLSYKELESDEEYQRRVKEKEIIKEEKYKEYLKLKQEFEGENNG